MGLPLSHYVNIMICQIFLPFTAVYSQSNQRNDIFTCEEKCFVQSRRTCQKYWVSDERNPTFVYKIYHKKRPNSMLTTEASFYLSINYSKDSGRCWFKAGAMGINKAGLKERPRLTNHSKRKTPLQ